MKSKPARLSSTEWPLALASRLGSPTLRSLSPPACSMASIRLVFPAPVGPTSASARTSPGGLFGIRRSPFAYRPPWGASLRVSLSELPQGGLQRPHSKAIPLGVGPTHDLGWAAAWRFVPCARRPPQADPHRP